MSRLTLDGCDDLRFAPFERKPRFPDDHDSSPMSGPRATGLAFTICVFGSGMARGFAQI